MGRLTDTNYSFSHSEMSTFKDCKRKWYLQYKLKLRRRKISVSKARDTGTLVHAALEVYYKSGADRNPDSRELMFQFLRNASDEDIARAAEEDRKDLKDVHATSEIVARGYLEWLQETGADSQYDFTMIETELRAPGPIEGTEIMGFVDLGGTEKRSGDLFVMDTKVVASIDDVIKMLHMNEQGPMYAILAKLNDPDPHRGFRVIWNMLKRNKQTARAKPPFYQRYELAINADQLRQFYVQLQGQMEEILRLEDLLNKGEPHYKVAYPTPSSDCSWKCPYVSICGTMNDQKNNDINYLINAYFTTPAQREEQRQTEVQAPRRMPERVLLEGVVWDAPEPDSTDGESGTSPVE